MNARERLAELEKNPKYKVLTPELEKKFKNHNLNDPKQNKKDGEIDKKWHKDKNGNFHHPDFE